MSNDDRHEPRAPLVLRVEYRRMDAFFAEYTKNLSKGGAFIRTATPLPVGTRFVFVLLVPAFARPVELEGEVTRALGLDGAVRDGGEPGMGVRFLFADDAARAAFAERVEQLMVSSLGPGLTGRLLGRKS